MSAELETVDLISWLESDEERSRPHRALRLKTLLKAMKIPEGGLGFQGGLGSAQAFGEIRLAYIHGLFLTTVLLALACIEQEIAGTLHIQGWDKAANASLETLLLAAKQRKIIDEREYLTFNRLRSVRNAYAHYRNHSHPAHLVQRAMRDGSDLDGVLAQDALHAISCLGTFLIRSVAYT
jgi:hypothetical protein